MDEVRRRRQWERIKQEAPDIADFLGELGAGFGKLAAIRVELDNGEVIEWGSIVDDPDRWDGKMRRMKYSEGWK